MRLTEQIQIKRVAHFSSLCHLSKNLYNVANYYIRQEFFYLGNWVRYYDLWYMLKDKEVYQKLPSQTSQQILRLVDKNWKSFFNSLNKWRTQPKNYQGRPRPPKYKKKNGEFMLIFTNQQCRIKEGYLHFPEKVAISPVKTRVKNQLHQVRIVPKGMYYIIEIIYEKGIKSLKIDKTRIVGIDLGLANIVTMVNNAGQPSNNFLYRS